MKGIVRGIALAVLFSLASWLPAPVGRKAAEAAGEARCAPTVDCGYRCSGRLTSGYCVDLFDAKARAPKIGPIIIRIGGYASCSICDCMYLVTDRNGTKKLKRTGGISCSGGIDGIRTFG